LRRKRIGKQDLRPGGFPIFSFPLPLFFFSPFFFSLVLSLMYIARWTHRVGEELEQNAFFPFSFFFSFPLLRDRRDENPLLFFFFFFPSRKLRWKSFVGPPLFSSPPPPFFFFPPLLFLLPDALARKNWIGVLLFSSFFFPLFSFPFPPFFPRDGIVSVLEIHDDHPRLLFPPPFFFFFCSRIAREEDRPSLFLLFFFSPSFSFFSRRFEPIRRRNVEISLFPFFFFFSPHLFPGPPRSRNWALSEGYVFSFFFPPPFSFTIPSFLFHDEN